MSTTATKTAWDTPTQINRNYVNPDLTEIGWAVWNNAAGLYPNLPGLKWSDASGNSYRAYVTLFDTANFINKSINFDYAIDQLAVGTTKWLRSDYKCVTVDDSKWVNTADGSMNSTVIGVNAKGQPISAYAVPAVLDDKGNVVTPAVPEVVVANVMKEYMYYCYTVGHNVPNVAFALYDYFVKDIASKEGLTVA